MADTFVTELQALLTPPQEAKVQATVDAETTLIAAFNQAIAALNTKLIQLQFDESINLDTQDAAFNAFENELVVILADLDANPPGGFTAPFTLNKGGDFPILGQSVDPNPGGVTVDFFDFEFEDSTVPTPMTISGSDYDTGGPNQNTILITNEARWTFTYFTGRYQQVWGSQRRLLWQGFAITNTTAQRDLVQGLIDQWKLAFPPTP